MKRIIFYILDDMLNNKYLNPLELDSYVRGFIKDEKTHYIMLDEIQRVFSIINPILTSGKIQLEKNIDENSINFVNVVLGLMQIPNVDLYISGSNSKFLSRDIMTEFRDRGDEIHMQPLSFKEYVDAVQPENLSLALNEYMLHGGMPVTLSYETAEEKEEYLKHLFSMTYHKDVEERNKIRNEFNLSTLTTVMASTVGSLTNPNKIANTFNTELKSNIGKDTIEQYLNYLEEAFVLRKVNRFDIKGRKHIGATYKYYFADPGLRNARRDFLHRDDGHIMENILYNELILRGYSVQVGVVNIFTNDKTGKTVRTRLETDFIAAKGSRIYYIQSAYSLDTPEKQDQETRSLKNIDDSFKKIVVVRESGPVRRDENGITYIGLEEFLLDEKSLDL